MWAHMRFLAFQILFDSVPLMESVTQPTVPGLYDLARLTVPSQYSIRCKIQTPSSIYLWASPFIVWYG